MGMMSKSIGRGMLKLLSNSGAGAIRHSLGDSKNPSAYVISNLIAAVDRMCITPLNETPPPINREFPESKEMKSKRKLKSLIFDTKNTYSFTIKGKNIDFCEWSTCGFRMINPTNLSTFIGNNPLRLVAYCDTTSKKQKNNSPPSSSSLLQQSHGHDQAEDFLSIQSRRRPGLLYFLEIEIRSQMSSVSFPVPSQSDSESDVDDTAHELAMEPQGLSVCPLTLILILTIISSVDSDIGLPISETEKNKLSVEELIRSDRVLSVHLTKTAGANFAETYNQKRPFSSPSRSQRPVVETVVESIEQFSRNSEPKSESASMLTANYLISVLSEEENEEENEGEKEKDGEEECGEAMGSPEANPLNLLASLPSLPPPPRSMRMVSVQLERISMEWTIEDMKYCPASIEINDYRR
jgi:hypothetical protein